MDLLLISRCPPFPIHLGDRLLPYHLSQQLASRNYHIDLIAFYDRMDDIAEIPRYERFFRHIQLIREPQHNSLDDLNRLLNRSQMMPTQAEQSWSPELWSAVKNRLSSNRYDMVMLFGGRQVYEYHHLVQRLPNVIVPYESKSLSLQNALLQPMNPLRRIVTGFQLNIARGYERTMFNGYDRTVVFSEDDAKTLQSLSPGLAVKVIPVGIDAEYFTPTGYEPDHPTLMFAGNFDVAANVDAAMWLGGKIFPLVQQRVPNTHLVVIGNNPPPAVRALATANGDIEVIGRVPDMRPFWEQALIFVSPLRSSAGVENKLLEAMAMQKPIVATPVSCTGLELDDGKNLLTGKTSEDLNKAILRLVKDGGFRREMAANNRQLVKTRYTWQRIADQYEELFDQVMQAHR